MILETRSNQKPRQSSKIRNKNNTIKSHIIYKKGQLFSRSLREKAKTSLLKRQRETHQWALQVAPQAAQAENQVQGIGRIREIREMFRKRLSSRVYLQLYRRIRKRHRRKNVTLRRKLFNQHQNQILLHKNRNRQPYPSRKMLLELKLIQKISQLRKSIRLQFP